MLKSELPRRVDHLGKYTKIGLSDSSPITDAQQ